MDEFGFSFAELLTTTWAPRGQRPVLKRIKKERRLVATAVGLSLAGKIYNSHFTGSIKSPQIIRFLQHLLQFFPKGFILIWDRARIHTSRLTQTFLNEHPEIIHEHLPAYAPNSIPKNTVTATSNNILEMLRLPMPMPLSTSLIMALPGCGVDLTCLAVSFMLLAFV
jgi:hypothetical protein